ncbi:MAG: hypothetical protein MRZ79_07950 [Bacteroidia bacterium]|nr:hypothetical protein [Bacteroidia bacterium]
MKRILSILLLGLYIFALYRPLMPLLDYAANYTYYSEILCVNKDLPELACKGQCVLMQRIQERAEKESPLNQIIINADEEIPEILPVNVAFLGCEKSGELHWNSFNCQALHGFKNLEIPPPQFRA